MNDFCECYHEIFMNYPIVKITPRCYGTKEQDICNCGGHKSKCDFYKKVRRENTKIMNTAEMWLKAQENDKTYQVKYGCAAFQKNKGLFNINNGEKIFGNELITEKEEFSEFMAIEWEEIEEIIMTKSEAEEKFNIKIIG